MQEFDKFKLILGFIFSNSYFYANKQNFLPNRWIKMKCCKKIIKVLFSITLKFYRNQTSGKSCDKV